MRQGIFWDPTEPLALVNDAGLFISLCTIQERTGAVNSMGQVDMTTWVNVSGLVNLPCMMSVQVPLRPDASAQTRRVEEIDSLGHRHVLIDGWYPQILQSQTAVIDSARYEIFAVESDSQKTQTRLAVRYWVQ